MDKLPDLERLTNFVHQEVQHDSLVRQSIEEGFMTEQELLVGRYVSAYCDLHSPEEIGSDYDAWEKVWQSNLPEAYKITARQFDVTLQRAEELFNKSLNIRARNIKH
jgi:hypothetical protein